MHVVGLRSNHLLNKGKKKNDDDMTQEEETKYRFPDKI